MEICMIIMGIKMLATKDISIFTFSSFHLDREDVS